MNALKQRPSVFEKRMENKMKRKYSSDLSSQSKVEELDRNDSSLQSKGIEVDPKDFSRRTSKSVEFQLSEEEGDSSPP